MCRVVTSNNWASEASPTLGCSIEISRDIYMYMYICRYVSYVKLTAWRNYVAHAHAQSHFLGGKD